MKKVVIKTCLGNVKCIVSMMAAHNAILKNWGVPTKVRKVAKIRNRYNQVPHLTQDTNGKVTN